jgi:F-box/leucine-rich repeat protein 10/11
MEGKDLTISYLQKYGFTIPLLFNDKVGLGLRVPTPNFSVNRIITYVGSRRKLDVTDVKTQKKFKINFKRWGKYYQEPIKDKLLNVNPLEFSNTKLEKYVKSPNIVRELDWVDCVWPRHFKGSQTKSTNVKYGGTPYPKVQKFCLMSVKGCYTDFHIDFGGASVWIHIFKGSKVFWIVPPTDVNISLYEQWILSGKQGDTFFGDTVKECGRVTLNAGDTFFIPTGWIYAVYTTKDSIVFGGHFLHSFGIQEQLRVAKAEESTNVPEKFRYPFFIETLWYVLERYVYCGLGISHLTESVVPPPAPVGYIHFSLQEIYGIYEITRYLHGLPSYGKRVPPFVKNPSELIKYGYSVYNTHIHDQPEDVISGKLILQMQGDKERKKRSHNSAGDMNSKMKIRKTGNANPSGCRRSCQCKRPECAKCFFGINRWLMPN